MALVEASVPKQVCRLAIFECKFVANLEVTVLILAPNVHKLTFGPVHSRIIIKWVRVEFLNKCLHLLQTFEVLIFCLSQDSETVLVIKVVWVFGVQSVNFRVVKHWQANLIKCWSIAAQNCFHF